MAGAEETDIIVLAKHDAESVDALARADRSMKERVPFVVMDSEWQVTSVRVENGMVVIVGFPFG